MQTRRLRRAGALLTAAALLTSLAAATAAAPTSAARPKCAGKTATIVGTNRGEVIRGTRKADVIVAKGGHDRVFGLGGNDLICGGAGHDRLVGNAGVDKLHGDGGRDRLFGGPGPDRLFGGLGPDTLAGQPGNDRLDGGLGVDACFQGIGTGPVVGCDRPAPPPAISPRLIDTKLIGILAVAYSDIDGLDGYSTGDVLIAKLVDTVRDGVIGPGDTIEMGRYPTSASGAFFADWKVKVHTLTSGDRIAGPSVQVDTSPTRYFSWAQIGPGIPADLFLEFDGRGASAVSYFQDFAAGRNDILSVKRATQSQPTVQVFDEAPGKGDDGFVDVEIYVS